MTGVRLFSVCVLAGLAFALLAWSVTRPNYREMRLNDGTVVIGSNHGVWWMQRLDAR
jgi:hypothetical protein